MMRLLSIKGIFVKDVVKIPWSSIHHRSSPTSTNLDQLKLVKPQSPTPNFDDPKEVFGGKSMKELCRAYIVFNLCSVELLVKHQFSLLDWTRKLLGRKLFESFMKSTVYGQFLAGDTNQRVMDTARKHQAERVVPMFQYTAQETHGFGGAEVLDDVVRWEKNVQAFKNSIDIGSAVKQNGEYIKVSGKLTVLTSTEVLKKVTSMVDMYTKVMNNAFDDTAEKGQGHLHDAVKQVFTSMKSRNTNGLVLPKVELSKDTIDSYATNMASHLALMDNKDITNLMKKNNMDTEVFQFTENEKGELLKVIQWMRELAEQAEKGGVCLLVDAEQSYLQLALDLVALDLKRQFNQSRAVVHNTYQCYRKRTLGVVRRDLKITENEKICFGAKVVRGAYIDEERKLAQTLGKEDPINETYEATTQMYQDVVTTLLRHLVATNERKPEMTFATHNLDSVKFIMQKMDELQISPSSPNVGFAQLLGMRDFMAFPLGKAGFSAHKLLHYGPVEEAVAYLSRRLAENKAGVATANKERQLLGMELRRRLNPFGR